MRVMARAKLPIFNQFTQNYSKELHKIKRAEKKYFL